MTFLRLSWPAFDGKVGNIAVDFGFGSSEKYVCLRTSSVSGRFSGLSDNKRVSRVAPADDKKGNRARITEPVAVLTDARGRRRAFALGSRRKPGHDASVGIPHSSNIFEH